MINKIKIAIGVLVVGFFAVSFLTPSSPQTADLGQVLDRTEFAIGKYSEHLDTTGVTEASDDQVEEFRGFLVDVLNSDPRFYEETQGLAILEDAKFLGFADTNSNGVKDTGEEDLYSVEIDEENNRLIGTDMAGNSTGLRFSGTGFIAGMLIGNLIGRQRGAGVSKGSFSNRTVGARSSYKAPRSARSGGLRAGK
ncbi:hypothetical protein [Sulfitobacter sp.]|jgi:hypothetical protein|uniref:hypothetical protein n=1 Tax=Sulfitobacter sp. TaxID=1903071 RepID=UPI0030034334